MSSIIVRKWMSPVGEMVLGSIGDAVCLCDWDIESRRIAVDRRICRCFNAEYINGESPVIHELIGELEEYFAGRRREFGLPLRFGGTGFQQRVWNELIKIPYGTTISYAELAKRIGNPKGVRAVASANAANAISILVPCHRVIGSDNRLTGYAGGIDAKSSLLQLERRVVSDLRT